MAMSGVLAVILVISLISSLSALALMIGFCFKPQIRTPSFQRVFAMSIADFILAAKWVVIGIYPYEERPDTWLCSLNGALTTFGSVSSLNWHFLIALHALAAVSPCAQRFAPNSLILQHLFAWGVGLGISIAPWVLGLYVPVGDEPFSGLSCWFGPDHEIWRLSYWPSLLLALCTSTSLLVSVLCYLRRAARVARDYAMVGALSSIGSSPYAGGIASSPSFVPSVHKPATHSSSSSSSSSSVRRAAPVTSSAAGAAASRRGGDVGGVAGFGREDSVLNVGERSMLRRMVLFVAVFCVAFIPHSIWLLYRECVPHTPEMSYSQRLMSVLTSIWPGMFNSFIWMSSEPFLQHFHCPTPSCPRSCRGPSSSSSSRCGGRCCCCCRSSPSSTSTALDANDDLSADPFSSPSFSTFSSLSAPTSRTSSVHSAATSRTTSSSLSQQHQVALLSD